MAAMQKDADERHERKKKAQEEAMVFKDKGNAEFKAGNYDQAIEFYTQVRICEQAIEVSCHSSKKSSHWDPFY